MTEEEKPILKMKYNLLNESIKKDIKDNYPKYYEKLF